MRRVMSALIVLLLVVGCSSGSDSGDIAFDHVQDMPTEESVFTATGEAIDNGFLCSAATGALAGFEGENGAVLTPEDIWALHDARKPFVIVSVESLTCDDGSGEFTLRFTSEIDPSVSNGEPATAVTWTITGDSGYNTTSGNGDSDIPHTSGDSFVFNGRGTINND